MIYHCKQIAVLRDGRRLAIQHSSPHPFMQPLPAVLTRRALGGRSGRKAYRVGTTCTATQMPDMTWHVEVEDSVYGLTQDGDAPLAFGVDFTLTQTQG